MNTSQLKDTSMLKEAIVKSFSQQAQTYAEHANVQAKSARILAQFLNTNIEKLAEGAILELGCGTGIFTEQLLQIFPTRYLTLSDVSNSMLAQCQTNLFVPSERVELLTLDAEELTLSHTYALIAASFSLQWVSDFYGTINRLLTSLKPGGELVFSIPTAGTFREWEQQCTRIGVPFTANLLPKKEELIDWCGRHELSLNWEQHSIACNYESALEFFRSVKGVGAAVNTRGLALSPAQLRRLISSWDKHSANEVQVTYIVLCARITRGLK